jgi:hypothetical protein
MAASLAKEKQVALRMSAPGEPSRRASPPGDEAGTATGGGKHSSMAAVIAGRSAGSCRIV